jgi:hypothetical protein
MGILVPEANLPMGITVSNVYMSFSGEVIYTMPNTGSNNYSINTHYKVYKDDTKQPDTNIRIPFAIQVNDISVGIYTSLYENLKQNYPSSVDC